MCRIASAPKPVRRYCERSCARRTDQTPADGSGPRWPFVSLNLGKRTVLEPETGGTPEEMTGTHPKLANFIELLGQPWPPSAADNARDAAAATGARPKMANRAGCSSQDGQLRRPARPEIGRQRLDQMPRWPTARGFLADLRRLGRLERQLSREHERSAGQDGQPMPPYFLSLGHAGLSARDHDCRTPLAIAKLHGKARLIEWIAKQVGAKWRRTSLIFLLSAARGAILLAV